MVRLCSVLASLALVLPSAALAQDTVPTETTRATTLRTTSRLELGIGFGIFARHYDYHQDVYGFLRDYDLPAGPEITFHLRAYPGAFTRHAIGDVFGAELRFDRSMGIQSERSNGVRFPTIQRILEVNALARYVRNGHELVGVVGYGHHAFELGRTEPSAPDLDNVPDVPSAGYKYVRLGAEGRVIVHPRVGFLLSASYLVLLDSGGIQDPVWFPRADGGGVAMSARVIVRVIEGLELRLGTEYRRYFLDMHAQPGDENIAGGALDQYVRTELTAAYRF